MTNVNYKTIVVLFHTTTTSSILTPPMSMYESTVLQFMYLPILDALPLRSCIKNGIKYTPG
jgi:hypothetical protein